MSAGQARDKGSTVDAGLYPGTPASKSRYWQHTDRIRCPKRHVMIWLGSAFWICEKCHTIYVQQEGK